VPFGHSVGATQDEPVKNIEELVKHEEQLVVVLMHVEQGEEQVVQLLLTETVPFGHEDKQELFDRLKFPVHRVQLSG
jgi:hypothetical protein